MKKVLIFSFFCSLFFTVSFAQKVKPVNYGGSVNLIEVRGRGYDAVLVLRTLGYGKNDALAQEDAEVRVIRALLYSKMCLSLLAKRNTDAWPMNTVEYHC